MAWSKDWIVAALILRRDIRTPAFASGNCGTDLELWPAAPGIKRPSAVVPPKAVWGDAYGSVIRSVQVTGRKPVRFLGCYVGGDATEKANEARRSCVTQIRISVENILEGFQQGVVVERGIGNRARLEKG